MTTNVGQSRKFRRNALISSENSSLILNFIYDLILEKKKHIVTHLLIALLAYRYFPSHVQCFESC